MAGIGTRDALHMDMKCIEFGIKIPGFTSKPLTLYYAKFRNGDIRKVWARDSVDMIDLFGGFAANIIEYGNVSEVK